MRIRHIYPPYIYTHICMCVCIYIYPPVKPPFPHRTTLGHHRVPAWAPVLRNSFPLAICFTHNIVHMSVLLSRLVLLSPPPLRPQVCSLHLHLHSFPAISSTLFFLDSIYTVFVFLFLTSLCITNSGFTHLTRTDLFVPFYGWIIFHCMYVLHHLYPFICWWTSRFVPYRVYSVLIGFLREVNAAG